MPVWMQVMLSVALFSAVLWWMWQLPRRQGSVAESWAPWLALLSPWAGMAALVTAIAHWLVPWPDASIVLAMLVLEPAAAASGILVLWVHRERAAAEAARRMQCAQARVGIGLALLAVALSYGFVMSHKTLFTPVGV